MGRDGELFQHGHEALGVGPPLPEKVQEDARGPEVGPLGQRPRGGVHDVVVGVFQASREDGDGVLPVEAPEDAYGLNAPPLERGTQGAIRERPPALVARHPGQVRGARGLFEVSNHLD